MRCEHADVACRRQETGESSRGNTNRSNRNRNKNRTAKLKQSKEKQGEKEEEEEQREKQAQSAVASEVEKFPIWQTEQRILAVLTIPSQIPNQNLILPRRNWQPNQSCAPSGSTTRSGSLFTNLYFHFPRTRSNCLSERKRVTQEGAGTGGRGAAEPVEMSFNWGIARTDKLLAVPSQTQ